MVVIGNEILSGRTRDANLAYAAGWLAALGVQLTEARFIRDDTATIVATINDLRGRHDYVVTSGGIGPTHDDITADAVAAAFGVGIDIDPRARKILEGHYEPGMLNEARLRMARIPFGAALIDNPVSRAPGFRLENVYVMAGVPAIFQAMLTSIRHELVGGPVVLSRSISARVAEGSIATRLGAIQADFPTVEIGSYPFYRGGEMGTAVVLRCTDQAALDRAAETYLALLTELGVTPKESPAA
jgi:molybdenum cofactor synthesis domain-containing protein